MKNFKIYAFLTFLFLGSISVSAQSMLNLYFGGNKDSLTIEATKLIQTAEPIFNQTAPPPDPDPALIAEMGFEQVYKSENRFFAVRDNKKIYAYRVSIRQTTSTVPVIF